MRDADVAMYRAKAQGGARHAVFDEAMHARVMQRLELETGLRHALERAPAARALPAGDRDRDRQHRRLRGAVPLDRRAAARAIEPREFVPIADETGLILPLGRFVLDEACRQLAIWRKHPRGKHISVSVNVSQPPARPTPASSSSSPARSPTRGWTRAGCGSRSRRAR